MAKRKKLREEIIMKERKRLKLFGLPFTFTTYTLTPKKLIINRGFFNTTEDEILLYRIVDMTVKSSFSQKVFGFGVGTLKLISSDKTDPKLDLENIKHYKLFRQSLSDQVESERLRVKFRAGEMIDRDAHYGDEMGDHIHHGDDEQLDFNPANL
ncbi:MAG: PH domain-containing protein [Oscillospiraceae bacterium]|jgi:hypothetical protein|nr:PH domain-containing protein [Oscillospiraceae bacterium]